VISLRVKLVAYFLALSLLPLAAGAWAFASSLAGHERQRVDERLSAELRAASAAYRERSGGARPGAAAERLLETLSERAGLAETDRLLIVSGSRVVAGGSAGATLDVPSGTNVTVKLDGERVRVAAATTSPTRGAVGLAVATPQASIDAATASAQRRLLVGVTGSVLIIALLAYAVGLAIVRTIRRFVAVAQAIAQGRLDERVPVRTRDEFGQLGAAFNDMADQLEAQRRRLHQASLRFGEALAAAHDIDQLLGVIVTTAVESTRATGGTIRGHSGDSARAGEPVPGGQTISVRLEVGGERFGTLALSGPRFEAEDRELVASLASHAVTALENARLHQVVQRQALLDVLTGMPNRRQCESGLATELAQAQRSGTPLAFVLADIDHFKAVNDRHGHPAGDLVLREFSDILRELMRESDLAARWGGEEFALVLPDTDEKGATVLVERIRSMLEHRAITVDGYLLSVTASFGVAMYPQEPIAARLIASADEALYLAKRSGRNRVESASPMPLSA
jgi:diguanylate cyclase (GGDEF)-like protein